MFKIYPSRPYMRSHAAANNYCANITDLCRDWPHSAQTHLCKWCRSTETLWYPSCTSKTYMMVSMLKILHTYRHISVQKHIHPLRAMFYSHSDAKVCIRPHSVSIPDKLPFGLLQYLVVVLNVIGYEKDSCE